MTPLRKSRIESTNASSYASYSNGYRYIFYWEEYQRSTRINPSEKQWGEAGQEERFQNYVLTQYDRGSEPIRSRCTAIDEPLSPLVLIVGNRINESVERRSQCTRCAAFCHCCVACTRILAVCGFVGRGALLPLATAAGSCTHSTLNNEWAYQIEHSAFCGSPTTRNPHISQ